MAVVLVPSLIDAVAARCAPHLPAADFLRSGSRAMAERLRTETAAYRDRAVSAILELSGQPAEPAEGQDPGELIDVVTASFVEALDPAHCRSASELFQALSPLPASNLGLLFGAIAAAAAAAAGDEAPPICTT
ncbi:MAG: hypothetical protein M3N07_05440 [Pseudomonadota bacterium]|nr:hypothetical protein [Pseudomonadota bacterium]